MEKKVTSTSQKYCEDCDKEHYLDAFCDKCHACLYKYGKQVKDDMYPLFKCEKCGKVNFWD